jgi:hypothetical protein
VAILEHVRSGFEVRSDLPVACETGITEALAITSFVNKETCNQPGSAVHAESVMSKTAAVPLEVWAAIDARRQKPSRAEQVQDALDALADEAKAGVPSCQSFVKRQAVQTAYAGAYAALQAEYTVAEVQSAMEKIRDVGSGSDELEPVVFTGHRELHDEARCRMCSRAAAALAAEDEGSGDAAFPDRTCYTAEAACLLFNRVRREGRIPTRWRLHRCLMHYKKHGLDPHHLGSYRGLGVDQALLKLMSLVMNERLEAYLTATGALSRSQGGFQRLKGPAEQAFTLAETVRFALQKKNVHIAYVDIERAYDSVQHPLLWKYCVEKGIDGLFLGTLQAIYYQAQAQLDVGGFLLDCVPLEQGVLQGNILSPALFNLYIDGAIRELEEEGRASAARDGLLSGGRPLGLPLPRVNAVGEPVHLQPPYQSRDQADWLACLFFADDGALLETDKSVLQFMLAFLTKSLASRGLLLNARKTKWMMAAMAGLGRAKYVQAIAAEQRVPLRVNDTAIEFSWLMNSLTWVCLWIGAGVGPRHGARQSNRPGTNFRRRRVAALIARARWTRCWHTHTARSFVI